MKVLHVASYLPPDKIGGVGQVVAHLHRGLLERGHESFVVTAGTTSGEARVLRIARTPAGFLARLPRHAALARDYDVVHAHQGDAAGLALAMRASRIRTPLVVTFHVGHRGLARSRRPYRFEDRVFARGLAGWRYRAVVGPFHRMADTLTRRLADATAYVSRFSARELVGEARAAAERVVYNGVPDAEGDGPEPERNAGEILWVGTDRPGKRLHLLPFVLREARARYPSATMRLVGVTLEHSPDLDRLFRDCGVRDAVEAGGPLESSRIGPLYARAAVLVMPSVYEGLPMVLLEAMRAGLPCVASRVGGNPEVLDDGVHGFLTAPDDPRALADRCVRVLADPALGRRMGAAGRARVAERFTVERMVNDYLDLYENAR